MNKIKTVCVAIGRCLGWLKPAGFRRVEVLRDGGRWEETLLCHLRRGDVYRMWEDDGVPYLLHGLHQELIADSLPVPIVGEDLPAGTWGMWAVPREGSGNVAVGAGEQS